jgi:hypothetical protein
VTGASDRITLLESTATPHAVSVESKGLVPTLTPLSATLTKSGGGVANTIAGIRAVLSARDCQKHRFERF